MADCKASIGVIPAFTNSASSSAPEEVELVRVDVRDEESVRSCVRTVLDRAGRIDALVNNADYAPISSLEETSIEEAKQLFETAPEAHSAAGGSARSEH